MSGSGLLSQDYALAADPVQANALALGAPARPRSVAVESAPPPPKNPETAFTIAERQRQRGENASGDPNAQNPHSSAGGKNQIIDSTWVDLLQRNKPELVEGKTREQLIAMKTDPTLNDEMARAYDQQNAKTLASSGIAPSPNFLNALYRAGPQGGMAIIRAAQQNPGTLVKDVAPDMATPGNNGAGNLTVGQFLMNPYGPGPGGGDGNSPREMFTIGKGNQILSQMSGDFQRGKERVDQLDRDYKPVEIAPPPKPPETDPLATFGSLAGVFATLAAGFSRTPAIAAMNSLSGAMDAAKKSDWDQYKAHYDQWKTNTDNMFHAHEVHSKDVREALEMMTHNMSAGTSMMNATLALSQDEEMQKLHGEQQYERMAKLQMERDENAQKLMTGRPLAEASAQLTAAMHNYEAATKGGDPAEIERAKGLVDEAQHRVAEINQTKYGTLGRGGIAAQTLTSVMADVAREHPEWSPGQVSTEATRRLAAAKKAPDPDSLLGPDELKPMVEAYMKGDKSQMANLGRGAQGAENLARFRKAWAQEMKAQGLSGADQASAFVKMASDMREAGAIGTRVGAIAVSGAEAKRVASLVTDAYEKLPRGQFRPYNQLVAMVSNKTNSPEQAAARAADFAMVTAYARALNPSGVPREADIRHGEELLSQTDSHESHAAVVNQMLLELDQIEAATGDARRQLTDRVAASHGFAPPSAGGGESRGSPFPEYPDARKAPDNHWYVKKDGKTYRIDP